MPASAQQLIEAAYSRSTANDPGKLATDGELLGVANRIYQMVYAIHAVASPESHTARTTVTLAGSPPTAALPTDIIDVRRVQSAAGAKINVIPVEEIDRGWHLAPAIYRQGNSIFSRAGAGDPIATDILTLFILDAPATLAALATTLDARYPVRFEELIVVELAMYLSTKDVGRDPGEFTKLSAYRNMQIEAFLKLCGLSLTALTTPHGASIVQTLNSIVGVKK